MPDLLFKTEDFVFSYRVAAICIQNGCVLLQKPTNDDGFAFPGGHVAFGETHEQTLTREFLEEIGAEVTVGPLKWVGEVFFPWGERPCHQICLYYQAEITDSHTPRQGMFLADEQLEGRNFQLEFHWVPLEKIPEILLYPTNCAGLLAHPEEGIQQVQHFIYREP